MSYWKLLKLAGSPFPNAAISWPAGNSVFTAAEGRHLLAGGFQTNDEDLQQVAGAQWREPFALTFTEPIKILPATRNRVT